MGVRLAKLCNNALNTYSPKHGWEFYVTLRLVPVIDPVRIRVSVNGKDFVFKGTSVFGKMSWKVEHEFLSALKETKQPILVGINPREGNEKD